MDYMGRAYPLQKPGKPLTHSFQEWRERLRSSLHPFLFAVVYRVTALVAEYLDLEAVTRAELLLAAPKVLQACFAATTDYFIWKLATKAYGKDSEAASAAVGLALSAETIIY